jgi:hypothetical protein
MGRILVASGLLAAVLWLGGGAMMGDFVAAQRPSGTTSGPVQRDSLAASELVAHSVMLEDGRQQLVVVDARQRSLAVYHVDPRTGALALKSVRNFHWDLQMEEFNAGGQPSPRDIRTLVEQR